jgi:cytochrome c oxidase subunit 4
MSAPIRMRTYVAVFLALLFFTGVTVAAAFVHLGAFNDVVALSVATAKALLVLIYFMHLRHSTRLTRIAVGAGFMWLGILIVLSLSDVLTRNWIAAPGK